MKKHLLIFSSLFLIVVSACSQSLSLSDSQGPIPNNSTVVPHGASSDDEIVAYAYVTNNSANAIPVLVKKVEVYLTPGTVNTFCWGLCYPPNIYISSESVTIDAGTTNYIDFSGHLAPNGVSGYSIIRYVFYNETEISDSVCMNVYFAHFPVAVEDPAAFLSTAYPNPACGVFCLDYSVPEDVVSSVILCTLKGNVMKQQTLQKSSGKVTFSTNDLENGVYLCSLIVNGRFSLTRKVFVAN